MTTTFGITIIVLAASATGVSGSFAQSGSARLDAVQAQQGHDDPNPAAARRAR